MSANTQPSDTSNHRDAGEPALVGFVEPDADGSRVYRVTPADGCCEETMGCWLSVSVSEVRTLDEMR
jgi:hypothetical protein